MKGYCKAGKRCQFAHGEGELQSVRAAPKQPVRAVPRKAPVRAVSPVRAVPCKTATMPSIRPSSLIQSWADSVENREKLPSTPHWLKV